MLRFPLAILVVFVHSFGAGIDVAQLHGNGFSGSAIYDYVRIFFSLVIARSAVPIFFIISGYLFFCKVATYNKEVYLGKLKKRWQSLVIPYLIWNLLFIIWTLTFIVGSILLHGKSWNVIGEYFIQHGFLHMLWNSSVWEERTTWFGVITHNSGPVLLPFWYMRDLIMMVVLSPVFYWLIKNLRFLFILLMMAVYIFDIRVSWMSGSFMTAGLFFNMGAYFAIMKQDFTDVLWKWRYIICPIAMILMVTQTYIGSTMDDSASWMICHWLVIVQSFALIIFASVMCRHRRIYELSKRLASTSFFIYAFHVFILGHVISLINKMMPLGDVWYVQIVCYFVSPLICVCLCVCFYCLLRTLCPSFFAILIGERGKKKLRPYNDSSLQYQ